MTPLLILLAAPGCTFCGDGYAKRIPLTQHLADSHLAVFGTLKNPKPAADGLGGTTELHVVATLKAKSPPAPAVVIVPRYVPVVGDTPAGYLLFCTETDGKPDPVHGVPATAAAADYLKLAAKLDRTDPARLGFFFQHLDSPDPAVGGDAFTEFARAPDADILKAAKLLDAAKVRGWLNDAATPADRISVYGMLLGLCGGPADAAWLKATLNQTPLPDRFAANLGGLAAGLTLLDAEAGWKLLGDVLADPKRPFADKLSAISAARYFWGTRPAEAKPRVLPLYTKLLADSDFADLAADDLRRWACWDRTADVLACYAKPTHQAPAVRRAVLRYALACPDAAAKELVTKARIADPKLVERVERK